MKHPIIQISRHQKYIELASKWFSNKWGVPAEAYIQSMDQSKNNSSISDWYIIHNEQGEIIAGAGVIENDFHNRKDLTPNLCALYVEREYRNIGLAKNLLDFISKDYAYKGFEKLYLITDHTNFYEKFDWQYYTNVITDENEKMRVYLKHTKL